MTDNSWCPLEPGAYVEEGEEAMLIDGIWHVRTKQHMEDDDG